MNDKRIQSNKRKAGTRDREGRKGRGDRGSMREEEEEEEEKRKRYDVCSR